MLRKSGILLALSSLPSPYGIGDMGPSARRFLSTIADCGQAWWQILPLHPVDKEGSPYVGMSAFAGNPLLISPDLLVAENLLDKADLDEYITMYGTPFASLVDYEKVCSMKEKLFRKAFENFSTAEPMYQGFKKSYHVWLRDWSLFMVIGRRQGSFDWSLWPVHLRDRDVGALETVEKEEVHNIEFENFLQFIFFKQWFELKNAANLKGVRIFGDIPIFIAHESADVWAHADEFNLDEHGKPLTVSGVPPDSFSDQGQYWGHPHYLWKTMHERDFSWWKRRFQWSFEIYDMVRVDHFRGLQAYWEIPVSSRLPADGKWVSVPGKELFLTLKKTWGEMPIVVEDLGVITDEVKNLRDFFELPGMRVFQFGFETDESNEHLSHNYPERVVAYTGTHDNNTITGFFLDDSTAQTKKRILEYVHGTPETIHWDCIRSVMRSRAHLCIICLQDIMGLGAEGRMNHPAQSRGNWLWRFDFESLKREHLEKLRNLTKDTRRFL